MTARRRFSIAHLLGEMAMTVALDEPALVRMAYALDECCARINPTPQALEFYFRDGSSIAFPRRSA